MRKLIITGCLAGASFFVGCNQNSSSSEEEIYQEKKLEMYEDSELALLMRKMYEDNLALGKQLEEGNLPESFPEDFYHIHDAVATKGMIHDQSTFNALADQYVTNMKEIEKAATPEHARIAYNEMILTCASCHQIYCQGPLAKIKRMQISTNE